MPTAHELFTEAFALHRAGKRDEAERMYREVLQADAQHFDALHFLGLLLHETKRTDEAITIIERAIEINPKFAEARYNLGKILQDQGKIEAAIARYQEAIALKPDYAEAYYNLGNAHRDAGRADEAVKFFREALRLKPDYAKAHTNLGNVFLDQEKFAEAVTHFEEALRLNPKADAHLNLSGALRNVGRLDEAVRHARKAIQLAPQNASGWMNLANALLDLEQWDDSISVYQESIRLSDDPTKARNNLAAAYNRQGRFEEALDCLEETLRLAPESPEAHFQKGMIRLSRGDFAGGWPEYEWRWKCKEFVARAPRKPPWDGTPLPGKTLVLHTEQGMGDTFQFIRYATLAKERVGKVVVRCPAKLIPLLGRCPGVDQFQSKDTAMPVFDAEAPLMSLPHAFHTTLDTIPRNVPYIFADPDLIEQWRKKLAEETPPKPFRVGIAWQGNPNFKDDRYRSIPLTKFGPLAEIPGVRLYSLQKGFGSEQLADAAFDVIDLAPTLDEKTGSFMDTAAVMKNLDLIITSDTGIAHLAGALGVPVWTALAYFAEWRWLFNRDDSPWYPTMRVFRQPKFNDWDGCFAKISTELRRLVGAPATPPLPPGENRGEGKNRTTLPFSNPLPKGEGTVTTKTKPATPATTNQNGSPKILFVTSSDAKFFGMAQGTILSIREKPQGESVPIAFLDVGCTPEQRTWLSKQVQHLVQPDWPYDFPGRDKKPSYLKASHSRPSMREMFPGYDVYVWIDADAWVQDWSGVELLVAGAMRKGASIVPESDRSYNLNYGKLPWYFKFVHKDYVEAYDKTTADRYYSFPTINAGVFAFHKDAPHWELWGESLRQALQNGCSHMSEQVALNLVVYGRGVFKQTEILPAWCNWSCNFGLPAWNSELGCLVEPYLPNHPIGIVHLTGPKHDRVRVETLDKGTAEVSLRYQSAKTNGKTVTRNGSQERIGHLTKDKL